MMVKDLAPKALCFYAPFFPFYVPLERASPSALAFSARSAFSLRSFFLPLDANHQEA